jgi:hypothetical protein
MSVTYDSSEEFVTAHAMFAELESTCLAAGAAPLLPYLGMARSEFTDYGLHLPEEIVDTPTYGTFQEGLAVLDGLLTWLATSSTRLHDTLRVQRAQEILREGMAVLP